MEPPTRRNEDLAAEIEERLREEADPEIDADERGKRLYEAFVRAASSAGYDEALIREQTVPGYEASGSLDSRVVIRTFERETVESLLPRGLELAPQPIVHRSRHPVIFLFSEDAFEAWFGDMKYRELMVAIPYVQRTDLHIPHRGPFLYMPRLYLDEKRPRLLGNRLYGFEKIAAKIELDDETYTVTEEDGDECAKLTIKELGEKTKPSALANFETVRRLFDMPTVSQGARIYDQDAWSDRKSEGFFICTNLRYHFDEEDAWIQPMRACLEVRSELTPRGLRTDPYDSESLADDELGSFKMHVRQTVSLPGSCSSTEFPKAPVQRRRKVVVLGGGPAACAAAFYLAQQRERYEVSMYTLGWRLGGKCAAGRATEHSERVEEHGLHAFVGFYDNVFRTVREVYDVAGLPLSIGEEPYDHDKGEGPLAAAFTGRLDVGLMDRHGDKWHYFETGQRFDGRIPGLIPKSEADELPGVGQVLLAIIERIKLEIDNMRRKQDETTALVAQAQSRESTWWRRLIAWLRRILGLDDEKPNKLAELLDRFTDYRQQLLAERIGDMVVNGSPVMRGLAEVFRAIRSILKQNFAKEIETDEDTWFIWANLDLALTVAIGIIASGTVNADDLDDQDFREWLIGHGLDPRNLEIAALTATYNTLFANEPAVLGDTGAVRPDNLACGVALRWFLLLGFGYKGFPAYDFKWSCPQTLITPYYRALQKLGVKVHFFHEVVDLQVEGTSATTRRLTGVTMRRQARVKGGSAAYRPFAPIRTRRAVEGHEAWPLDPLWEQLHDEDAAALRERGINLEDAWSGWEGVGEVELKQGVDFDDCVLGVSLGALREPARQLYDPEHETAAPEWTEMMERVKVTPTASFQLWFDQPWDRLYSGPHRDLLTGFEQPWPSLGDLTHLIEWEGWPRGNTPRFLAYHTGALLPGHPLDEHPPSERDYPAKMQAEQAAEMKAWLERNFNGMYDKVESFDDFLALLNAPEGVEGHGRLDAQYFHAAIQPSDLYVLSQAKTISKRLGQGESGFKHLFLCGDWTRTSMNCGCVEAATQSGMLASRVISNEPRYVWSPGF